MRLIDADKLLEKTECLFKDLNSTEDYMGIGYNHGVGDSIAIIKNAPTIEAEPVKHGRWIIRDNPGTGWYRVTCSECGEDVTSVVPVIGFFPDAKVVWDYCPNCGAVMEEQ